jgi:chemotaxis protein methyltransferase CheR
MVRLKKKEFENIKDLIYNIAGIYMKPEKIVLVENRLAKKIRKYNLSSYKEYYDIVTKDKKELQEMINHLTTNETSFFRESKHFELLRETILPKIGSTIKVWSAACSTGAEGYSIAMTIDDFFSKKHGKWDILLSDINEEVIEDARIGLYPLKYMHTIPNDYLSKYCLRGTGKYDHEFLIKDYLKSKLKFMKINLNNALPDNIEQMDIIFLRNILIYFDNEKKKHIVENVISKLKKGGYLFIGHSETLNKITDVVQVVEPTVYQKV